MFYVCFAAKNRGQPSKTKKGKKSEKRCWQKRCGVVFYLSASREGTETSRKVRRNRAEAGRTSSGTWKKCLTKWEACGKLNEFARESGSRWKRTEIEWFEVENLEKTWKKFLTDSKECGKINEFLDESERAWMRVLLSKKRKTSEKSAWQAKKSVLKYSALTAEKLLSVYLVN